jgi:predicted DNA-binding protein
MKKDKVRLSLRLGPRLKKRLKLESLKTGMPVCVLVEEILNNYFYGKEIK